MFSFLSFSPLQVETPSAMARLSSKAGDDSLCLTAALIGQAPLVNDLPLFSTPPAFYPSI